MRGRGALQTSPSACDLRGGGRDKAPLVIMCQHSVRVLTSLCEASFQYFPEVNKKQKRFKLPGVSGTCTCIDILCWRSIFE